MASNSWRKTILFYLVIIITGGLLFKQASPMVAPHVAIAQGGGTHIYFPLVITSPLATASHYMNMSEPDFDPYTLGEEDAQYQQQVIEAGNRIIFILAWGQPCKISSNTWGAYSYDSSCHAISEIQINIENYLDGYCARMDGIRSGDSGQYCGYRYNTQAVPVIIGFGVDNCIGGEGCSNPPGSPSNAVTYEHGQAWGQMVQAIADFVANRGYSYQVFIVGAMDIEAPWNTYTNTKAWLDGYKNTSYRNFYNYGTCDCPDGYQPYAPFSRDWNYGRIHEVSYRGLPIKYALPEIYHTSGIDARRWQGLSKWAVINGYGKMTFQELLTEFGACDQVLGCLGIDNKPIDAAIQVISALDADPQTAGGLVTYARFTDISWYPRP